MSCDGLGDRHPNKTPLQVVHFRAQKTRKKHNIGNKKRKEKSSNDNVKAD